MTVRRSLVAAAVAVFACVLASGASAASSPVRDGGATAPAAAAPASTAVARGRAELLAALAKEKAPSRPKHRLTGEFASESTPLVAATTTKKAVSPASGAGTSWLRTIGGLLLVVGAIYGVAWVMRRVKRSREEQATGRGLTSIATLPLGAGRALHLVRAGSDVIVVGTSEHGVAPIQRYTEEEALANGVLDDGRRDGLMHEAAGAFMPDGSPQPPVASGWRAIDDGAGNPTMVDLLRRLTVRS